MRKSAQQWRLSSNSDLCNTIKLAYGSAFNMAWARRVLCRSIPVRLSTVPVHTTTTTTRSHWLTTNLVSAWNIFNSAAVVSGSTVLSWPGILVCLAPGDWVQCPLPRSLSTLPPLPSIEAAPSIEH